MESWSQVARHLRTISKYYPPRDPVDLNLAGQTVVVTGSNTGIGREAAIKVARQNAARVILAVRTESKGQAVVPLVKEAARDPQCDIQVWPLEMADYDSIQAFVGRAQRELPDGIHAAILNAGMSTMTPQRSKYGWGLVHQVNAISTVLLGVYLVPLLRKTRTSQFKPTLVFVTSGGSRWAPLTRAQQQGTAPVLKPLSESLSGMAAYTSSKLVSMYGVKQLGQMVGDDVWVPAVCPGASVTDIAREGSWAAQIMLRVVYALYFKSAEQGARSVVSGLQLAERGHGEFWQADEIREPTGYFREPVLGRVQQRVWSELEEAWAKDVPGIQAAIAALR